MSFSALQGAIAAGTTGAVTFVPNASHAADDIEFCVMESSKSAIISETDLQGFVKLDSQTSGGTAVQGQTLLSVYWRRWNGSDGSPQFTSDTNHLLGKIVSFRGCIASGSPFEDTQHFDSNVQDQNVVCPSVTTSTSGDLVIAFEAQGLPDNTADPANEFSSWSNANLTGLTELVDASNATGNGGCIGVAYGVMASTGAVGTITATAATSSYKAAITTAVLAEVVGGGPTPTFFPVIVGI